jgi:hypothetical protein
MTADTRPEILLNTCVAALRLDGCGAEAIAFMLAEGAVDALTAAEWRSKNARLTTGYCLRAENFDGGVEHLVDAMRERAAGLRALRRAPALMLVGNRERA